MATLEKIPKDKLLDMFRKMLLSRHFEERLIEERNIGGRVTSCPHIGMGQEAIGIGAGARLRKDDYIRTRVVMGLWVAGCPSVPGWPQH